MAGLRGIRDGDIRDVARRALDQGWRLEQRGSHIGCRSPKGDIVMFSGTASGSNGRSLANVRAAFRRAGLADVTPPRPKPVAVLRLPDDVTPEQLTRFTVAEVAEVLDVPELLGGMPPGWTLPSWARPPAITPVPFACRHCTRPVVVVTSERYNVARITEDGTLHAIECDGDNAELMAYFDGR